MDCLDMWVIPTKEWIVFIANKTGVIIHLLGLVNIVELYQVI